MKSGALAISEGEGPQIQEVENLDMAQEGAPMADNTNQHRLVFHSSQVR